MDDLERLDADDDPRANSRGVELTSEELAAIREATREAAGTGAVLVVSRPEDQSQWSDDLAAAGIEPAFVTDTHQLMVALRDRDVETVIIDADACASGGLSALAVLRTGVARSSHAIVVVSSPTRTHLVRCLAAGATGYLARPFGIDELNAQLKAS